MELYAIIVKFIGQTDSLLKYIFAAKQPIFICGLTLSIFLICSFLAAGQGGQNGPGGPGGPGGQVVQVISVIKVVRRVRVIRVVREVRVVRMVQVV